MKKTLRRKSVTALGLLLLILLLSWFNTHPAWVETIYARNIYPLLGSVFRLLLGELPFSLGDLLYLTAIAFLVIYLARFFRRLFARRFRPALSILLTLVIAAETGILIFYLFWGMNYFRHSAAQRLHLDRKQYDIEELVPAAEYIISRANHYRSFLSKKDLTETTNREIYETAARSYRALATSHPAFFIRHPSVKPSFFTPLINFMGVAGYFNPFTGEAQLNFAMPTHVKPFVACHEIAHQAGFGPEDAASFAGFLAGTHSGSVLLQYSVYYTAMKDLLHEIVRRDRAAYSVLYASVSPTIKTDLETERAYWARYRGPVDAVSDFFYDHFLKANNQPKGLQTYNEMISLLIAYYHKEGILKTGAAPVGPAPESAE